MHLLPQCSVGWVVSKEHLVGKRGLSLPAGEVTHRVEDSLVVMED